MRLFVFIVCLLFTLACEQNNSKNKEYDVRADIRLGTAFYSIFVNEQGFAYVIRGSGTDYNEQLEVKSSDTSAIVRLDSVRVFYRQLNELKKQPHIFGITVLDAPRVEVYYDSDKIYDSNSWNAKFWDLFRPIATQLPKGYNPFTASDHPFQ